MGLPAYDWRAWRRLWVRTWLAIVGGGTLATSWVYADEAAQTGESITGELVVAAFTLLVAATRLIESRGKRRDLATRARILEGKAMDAGLERRVTVLEAAVRDLDDRFGRVMGAVGELRGRLEQRLDGMDLSLGRLNGTLAEHIQVGTNAFRATNEALMALNRTVRDLAERIR